MAVAAVLLLSSCASLNVNAIPIPGNSYSHGYDIIIEFENILNLPDRAKVVMDGTKVGVVKGVALTSHGVDVTARIDSGVAVPSDIHSVMQQATVLGDTYIALEAALDALPTAPPLRAGGRIPAAHTTSPPQLEDTLANMANFVGSGAIQRAQNTLIKINRITPPRPEIRAMASRVALDLSDVSKNIDDVDLWLRGVSETANVLEANAPELGRWFTPQGVTDFHHNFILSHYLAPIVPTLGTIYYNGYWLTPALTALADSAEAFQHSKWAFDEEVPRWQHLFTDYFLPERRYPAINITSIKGPDGRELSGNIQEVLRMIGAMP
ncbi:MlaD family protein [Mycobacterium vicinigordonae]|nr:MlaD family protein [Mycobacterium vicinigordonae]